MLFVFYVRRFALARALSGPQRRAVLSLLLAGPLCGDIWRSHGIFRPLFPIVATRPGIPPWRPIVLFDLGVPQ